MKTWKLEKDEKEKLYLQAWNDEGRKIYSDKDIPAWVVERLGRNSYYSPEDRLKGIIESVKRYHNGRKKQFCILDGSIFFPETGYRKIIDYVRKREMLREDEIQRWEDEVFGAGD